MATSTPAPVPIVTDKVIEDLERQVEEQSQRILDLKESLAQKDALYLATSDKLRTSEEKRIELETSLVNLATGKKSFDCKLDAQLYTIIFRKSCLLKLGSTKFTFSTFCILRFKPRCLD